MTRDPARIRAGQVWRCRRFGGWLAMLLRPTAMHIVNVYETDRQRPHDHWAAFVMHAKDGRPVPHVSENFVTERYLLSTDGGWELVSDA